MEKSMPAGNTQQHSKTTEKKRQILQHALRCFTEHGVDGTTVDMIREQSGMSVGSLYHHFGNKDKIASALFIQGMRDFGDRAREYLAQLSAEASAEDGIKALVYANVDWISDNPDWARFVFHHRSTLKAADSESRLQEDMQIFYKDLAAFFIPRVQAGQLKPIPMDLFSPLVSGPTHQYARQWLAGRSKTPVKAHRELLAESAWASVKAR